MRILPVLALALLLASCTTVSVEPALEMPTRPKLHFSLAPDGRICLPQEDAAALGKYFDKLDAFDAGRQRVLKGAEPPK